MPRALFVFACLVACGLATSGCRRFDDEEEEEEDDDDEHRLELPMPDPVGFEEVAYPILLADCGFAACHGDPRRFFVIFGPGHVRLDAATEPEAPATPEELALSYTRAASMLTGGARTSLLLRKGLAIEAGGAPHEGDDPWGSPIYRSTDDPRWLALYRWAATGDVAP